MTYLKTKRNVQGKTVCAAYKGTVGGQGSCLIYENRPLVCRAFEPGAKECLDARKVVGLD